MGGGKGLGAVWSLVREYAIHGDGDDHVPYCVRLGLGLGLGLGLFEFTCRVLSALDFTLEVFQLFADFRFCHRHGVKTPRLDQ